MSLSASTVQPQHTGGGEQRRFGFVAGKGDLATDGWNIYTAFDTQRASSLQAEATAPASPIRPPRRAGRHRFRAQISGVIGSSPANYTVYSDGKADHHHRQPLLRRRLRRPLRRPRPRSPSTRASGAGSKDLHHRSDPVPGTAAGSQQTTLFTKGSLAHGDGKMLTVELQLAALLHRRRQTRRSRSAPTPTTTA